MGEFTKDEIIQKSAADRETALISRLFEQRIADYVRRGVDVPVDDVLELATQNAFLAGKVRELENEVTGLKRSLNVAENNYDDALRHAEDRY